MGQEQSNNNNNINSKTPHSNVQNSIPKKKAMEKKSSWDDDPDEKQDLFPETIQNSPPINRTENQQNSSPKPQKDNPSITITEGEKTPSPEKKPTIEEIKKKKIAQLSRSFAPLGMPSSALVHKSKYFICILYI